MSWRPTPSATPGGAILGGLIGAAIGLLVGKPGAGFWIAQFSESPLLRSLNGSIARSLRGARDFKLTYYPPAG